MEFLEAEIAWHDWSAVRCGCGQDAGHVAEDLLWLAHGGDGGPHLDTDRLDGHVFTPSVLCEPAVPALRVALAALADDEVPVPVRRVFSELVLLLAAGEGQTYEAAQDGRDLETECFRAAQEGIWLLCAVVLSAQGDVATASNAYEALTLLDDDEDRLARVRSAGAKNLRPDLR